MSDAITRERLGELHEDFQKINRFHETSFREIDAKTKYWLTVSLPTFIALAGLLSKEAGSLDLPLVVAGYALEATLFVSIILLSWALGTRPIECGILRPSEPRYDYIAYFLESDERWLELQRDRLEHLLISISNNEQQNSKKSNWLSKGEASLLRGSPTAICVGAGVPFGYTAACPSGLAISTASGAIAGVIIGLFVSAVFVAIVHNSTRK